MSNKRKKDTDEDKISNYYDLKVKETEELVAILKDEQFFSDDSGFAANNDYEGMDKKFNPYKHDKLAAIPFWIKALFIKWWFVGAVSFFMVFGFSSTAMDTLDRIVVIGIILGIIVDVLVNPIFRMIESDKKEYNWFMMFPFEFKCFWTFFANIIYYIVVYMIVAIIYGQINVNFGNLQVEPVLSGLFTLIVDMVFIGIKDGVVALVKKMSHKRKEKVNV